MSKKAAATKKPEPVVHMMAYRGKLKSDILAAIESWDRPVPMF